MAKGNVLARAVHVMQFHQQLCDLQHMLAVCMADACRKNIGKTNDKKAKGSKGSKGKKRQKGSKRIKKASSGPRALKGGARDPTISRKASATRSDSS